MSTTIGLIAAGWVVVGLATGIWMARRGHDPLWILIAVVLGPLFVPIAWERVEHGSKLAASGGSSAASVPAGRRALVGVDGSPESQRAFDAALELLGPQWGSLMLVEVVPFEVAEDTGRGGLDIATKRVADLAARAAAAGVAVNYEVLAGPPGETLRRAAEEFQSDIVIVGRRGRGLSKRVLGSVCEDLIRHSPTSVLVTEPVDRSRT